MNKHYISLTESRKGGVLESLNPEEDKDESNKIEIDKFKHKGISPRSSDDKQFVRSRSNS